MLAIIPARGGSKGLPGKNIRDLNGKPLIGYTIEAALKSKFLTKVIVNTDSEEIANIAINFGAEVPFLRPTELATDSSTTNDVLLHTLKWFEDNEKKYFSEIVVLQPTSPLRTFEHINEAIQLFKDKNAKSVISYCEEEHPVFWNKYITDEGKLEDVFKLDLVSRQNYKKTYRPNGAIYVVKKSLIERNNFYDHDSYAYLMPVEDSIDIDTLMDFRFAEFLIKNKL